MLYSRCDILGCSSFASSSMLMNPSIWPKDFELFKGLYSTALLSSLWASWPTRVFWYCFISSAFLSWQQFCHIGRLHRVFSSQWMLTLFFQDLSSPVMFEAVSLLSCKLLIQMKFSSARVVAFAVPALFLALFSPVS